MKNNKMPDWNKFYRYCNIDSEAKLRFMKEALTDRVEDIAQQMLRKLVKFNIGPMLEAIDFEMPIVLAAVRKRFGSEQKAQATGMDMVVQSDTIQLGNYGTKTTRMYAAMMPSGEEIKLVAITTTQIHDGFEVEHRSYVGDLKL